MSTTRRRPPAVLVAAALLVLSLVALPLVYLVLRAAGAGSGPWSVLGRSRTLELVVDTIALVAGVTLSAVAIGVPLAWLVTRTDLPGRRFWLVAATVPLAIPSYVVALALIAAFGPRGLLQRMLAGPFGVERVPDIYGYPGALLALTIATYPYVLLLTAVALRELDPALEETARSLGRGRAATFFRVTLPLLRPSIGAGALLAALYTLSDFGAVSLMQTSSLTRAIFLQYRALFDRNPAVVLSLVLVALTTVVLVLEFRARGRARLDRAAPGPPRPPARVRLGRWRWAALAFVGGVVLVALGAPLAVLVYWAARAPSVADAFASASSAALGSVVASGLAALVAVVLALPTAQLAVRYPSRWTSGLERAAYGANALPGIVIALSLVFFAANYASPVYQTLFLLVVAYVIRFFPLAVAGAHSAYLRVPPRLEEAARGLGRSPAGTSRP